MALVSFVSTSIQGRYARTLYGFVKEDVNGTLEKARAFWNLVEEAPDLKRTLLTPLVSEAVQKKVMERLIHLVELPSILSRFMLLLQKKGRFSSLPLILNQLQSLHHKEIGVIDVKVASAMEFSGEEEASLVRLLKESLGKEISCVFSTDPSLLAGYRVYLPTEVWDASLFHQLHLVQQSIQKAQS